jgi:hypothetical protein
MITKHDLISKVALSGFHLKFALDKAKAYADTPLGAEIVQHLEAIKRQFKFIEDNIEPSDLLDKV